MKPTHKQIFIGIILFWVLILGGFIGMKEWTLRTGTEVLLTMRPVDPRDIFRGDYVILSYEISRLDAPASLSATDGEVTGSIYVHLTVDEEGIARARGMSVNPPSEGLFIKGKVIGQTRGQVQIEYGIESYFVPEGRGRKIERNLHVMHAKVAIDSTGKAVLKGLVYQGEAVRL